MYKFQKILRFSANDYFQKRTTASGIDNFEIIRKLRDFELYLLIFPQDDAPSVSNFENLGQDLELALKDLLEDESELVRAEVNSDAVKKAKSFYQMCLNESQSGG